MAAGDSPTYDGIFYSRINKSAILYQPNYTRVRHRYRGHRESEKINLEMGQMFADLAKIDLELTTVEDNLETNVSNLLDGVTHSEATFTDEDATPTDETVTLIGLNAFQGRMAALEQRIKRLEDV